MLEILILFYLCKSIGDIVRNKGRMAIGYQALAVALWFGGEFGAAFFYVIVSTVAGFAPEEGFDLSLYLVALMGAASGAAIAYLIAKAVPEKPLLQDYAGHDPYAANQAYAPSQPTQYRPLPDSQNPYNPYDAGGSFGQK